MDHLFYIVNIMGTDDLTSQGIDKNDIDYGEPK